MFKAIGRWGSQVKNTISVHIIGNIFSSKSKRYGDLHNDEEEIFCDAQEELSDSETESEHEVVPTTTVEKIDIVVKADINLNTETTTVLTDAVNAEETIVKTQDEASKTDTIKVIVENSDTDVTLDNLVTFDASDGTEVKDAENDTKDTTADDNVDSGNASSSDSDDDDDHHDSHKDTKKIMKNSKSSNGLVKSASAAVIQKVHRRMNSYSQRQYAKFDDSPHDDENDNVVSSDVTTSQDDVDNNVFDKFEPSETKTDKKTKRKKKIAKRTRKAVRGTWKWFKRSMVAYSNAFNFSAMFVVNVTTAAKK